MIKGNAAPSMIRGGDIFSLLIIVASSVNTIDIGRTYFKSLNIFTIKCIWSASQSFVMKYGYVSRAIQSSVVDCGGA